MIFLRNAKGQIKMKHEEKTTNMQSQWINSPKWDKMKWTPQKTANISILICTKTHLVAYCFLTLKVYKLLGFISLTKHQSSFKIEPHKTRVYLNFFDLICNLTFVKQKYFNFSLSIRYFLYKKSSEVQFFKIF